MFGYISFYWIYMTLLKARNQSYGGDASLTSLVIRKTQFEWEFNNLTE